MEGIAHTSFGVGTGTRYRVLEAPMTGPFINVTFGGPSVHVTLDSQATPEQAIEAADRFAEAAQQWATDVRCWATDQTEAGRE